MVAPSQITGDYNWANSDYPVPTKDDVWLVERHAGLKLLSL